MLGPRKQRRSTVAVCGFNCFLQTSELLALQFCHLLPNHSKPEIAVVIPFPKTSNGNAQVLLVKDDRIWQLACALKKRRAFTAPLWAGSPIQCRTTWPRLLECQDIRPDDYIPYGIRRGGATWFFLETFSLDATLARGRWATFKTARSYIDDGALILAQQQWSVDQRHNVKLWMRKNRGQWATLETP